LVNPNVGMLFIAMHGKPQRLRVNGTATVSDDDPLVAETLGAQLIVRITCAGNLSELSEVHPDYAVSRAIDLCAPIRPRSYRTGMETIRRIQGVHESPSTNL